MNSIEEIVVDKREVSCDGGGGGSGHPRVFLNMGDRAEVACPYCGRLFKLSKEVAEFGRH